mmetsp:Transcript_58035/g.147257  ORF Transcript_58035/g.147257 Transcript_58035/m.147257 type:complete len:255 (-) Transcript_58035:291-1055(-)
MHHTPAPLAMKAAFLASCPKTTSHATDAASPVSFLATLTLQVGRARSCLAPLRQSGSISPKISGWRQRPRQAISAARCLTTSGQIALRLCLPQLVGRQGVQKATNPWTHPLTTRRSFQGRGPRLKRHRSYQGRGPAAQGSMQRVRRLVVRRPRKAESVSHQTFLGLTAILVPSSHLTCSGLRRKPRRRWQEKGRKCRGWPCWPSRSVSKCLKSALFILPCQTFARFQTWRSRMKYSTSRIVNGRRRALSRSRRT